MAILTIFSFSASAEVIYYEDFSGSVQNELDGTSPDINNSAGGNTWTASWSWRANGYLGTWASAGSSATLPFSPESGKVYQITATFRDVEGDGDWLALGYAQGSSSDFNERFIRGVTTANPWMLRRGNTAGENDQIFLGPGTGNGSEITNTLDRSSDLDFRILLDTRNSNWSVEWYQKLNSDSSFMLIDSQQYSSNPPIAAVGFANAGDGTSGYVDDFTLETLAPLSISIIENPKDTAFYSGMDVSFQVTFTSNSTPQAEWYKVTDGGDTLVDDSAPDISTTLIYNSTSQQYTAELEIANTASDDAAEYYCLISNSEGDSITSGQATLENANAGFVANWTLDRQDYHSGEYFDVQGGHNAAVNEPAVFTEGIRGGENSAADTSSGNGWATSPDFQPTGDSSDAFSVSIWSRWNNPENNLFVITALGGTAEFKNSELPSGQWKHLCITYDGEKGRIYINSRLVYSEYWRNIDIGSLYAQIAHENGGEILNGAIDEIRMYNYALSELQISTLYSRDADCILPYKDSLDVSGAYGVPDCLVNFYDYNSNMNISELAEFADGWLSCGFYPGCN